MSKLISLIANTSLAAIAVIVIGTPLLLGQLIGNYQSGALGESTTQSANQAGGLFTVQANPDQFAPYVEFDPQPMVSSTTYQTSVTFTSFAEQQAAYNGLLTITNTSSQPLTIQAQTGTASGVLDNTQIWLNLVDDSVIPSTLTTQAAAANSQTITVAQTTGFNSGHLIIQDKAVLATALNATTLSLQQPLTEALPVGQKVYYGSAFFSEQAKPIVPATQSITIAPSRQASLNLVVATETSSLDTHQLVIPLAIVVK